MKKLEVGMNIRVFECLIPCYGRSNTGDWCAEDVYNEWYGNEYGTNVYLKNTNRSWHVSINSDVKPVGRLIIKSVK